jgi:pimeloyl-ACP methyl ester carboxylesterase
MTLDEFYADAKTVSTRSGEIGYVDTGEAGTTGNHAVAVFVHGVATSGYLWHKVIEQVRAERRCVALDLPLHGRSPALPDQDLSLPAMARAVEDFCEALGLGDVDLVANDTGGAIAQIFAAHHPERLRTFALTNCDTHDNIPPDAFRPTVELAAAGQLAPLAAQLLADPGLVRQAPGLSDGYEEFGRFDDETIRAYIEAFLRPVFGTPESGRAFERILTSMRPEDLMGIEPELRRLTVPTLVVWGTGDAFFDVQWAYWLRDTIPGVTEVVEIPGAKLFFPDERAADLVPHLRRHWSKHAG